jgi:hypothetical protein
MSLDAANVRTGISGEVSIAAVGTTAPTSAVSVLDAEDFTGLGYLSSAGIVPEFEVSSNPVRAFQNNQVVRVLVNEAQVVYKFTLIETSKTTIEFAFATTVTQSVTEGTYTITPGATGGQRMFVIDVIDGDEARREWFDGELTEMVPSGWVNGEAVQYECTVTAYTAPTVKDTSLKTPA